MRNNCNNPALLAELGRTYLCSFNLPTLNHARIHRPEPLPGYIMYRVLNVYRVIRSVIFQSKIYPASRWRFSVSFATLRPFMRPLLFLAVWFLGIAHSFAALEVRNPRWGFGGKAVLGTFNVLAVEVRNLGPQTFEGGLVLQQKGGGRATADLVQPIFLAPGTSRWVQFTPYIGNYKPDFKLVWGEGGDEQIDFDDNGPGRNTGERAVVVLADPEVIRSSKLPVMPEELFPVTVSATDGLHAVVLDHVPRLQPVQREAFLDWVKLGGIVHVVPGPTGVVPEFDAEYAILKVEGERARAGSGVVVKHSVPVAELTPEVLAKADFPVPAEPKEQDSSKYERYNRYDYDDYSDSSFFRALSGVTKPKISWWLIYLLTGVYVIIIGPVFFFLRKKDYRVLLGGFLVTVAVFAWCFTVIGRRGYGESQVCHSLAVARMIGDGRYDVTHWSHAFATSGDVYRLAYPGSSHLYSPQGGEGESVRGQVMQGKDAFFDADIPLFSFRNFLHRGVMAAPEVPMQLASEPITSPNWRKSFKITLGGEIPGEVLQVIVQVGDRYYRATKQGNAVVLPGDGTAEMPQYDSSHNYNGYYYGSNSAEEALRELKGSGSVLGQRFGGEPGRVARYLGRIPGRDTVRVYIYAAGSSPFRMSGNQFTTGRDFVLYLRDLPMPATPK